MSGHHLCSRHEAAIGDRREFIALFTRATKAVRAVSEPALKRHGLRLGQNLVLDVLCEHDGQTPGEIAAQLNVTTPTVVKMATRMSAAGLLTRRRDPADNRLVRLYLTDAGRALVRPVEDEIDASVHSSRPT